MAERGLMMFRPFFQKLRKGWVSASRESHALSHAKFDDDMSVGKRVPDDDVKEGFFTVFAVKGKETQRFVVELDHLRNPAFLNLLDQAREEYGFQQKGALSLPCRPHELQEILEQRKEDDAGLQEILEQRKEDDAGLHVMLPY